MSTKSKTKKKFKMPNTYVLVFSFIILAAILTYIIPAGLYSTYIDPVTGIEMVDATSFGYVEGSPATLFDILFSIPNGMTGNSSIIFVIFVTGGVFQVINDTNSVTAGIDRLVKKFGDKSYLIIPIIVTIMSILGALGIVVSTAIALVPLGLIVAKRLKADALAGLTIIYIGAYAGFCTSPMIPATLQYAQTLAGLQPLSGFTFRLVVCIITTLVTIIFAVKYVKELQEGKRQSIVGEIDLGDVNTDEVEFTKVHAGVLFVTFLAFAVYAYGAFNLGWGNNQMSGMLIFAMVASAVIARVHPDKVAAGFIKGAKDMTFGALIVGVAAAISNVMSGGVIIHTIIYAICLPLAYLPQTIAAVFMFIINLVFNFFVSSGAGQAAIVMPLMAPMADVLDITRQVSVLAYQWGDGFSNILIPTSGVLMGCLGVAKVPFEKWLKFIMPLFLSWTAIGVVGMVVSVLIGYM